MVAAVAASSFASESSARAGETFATPCADKPYYCETAPITFDKTDALPIQFMFDTGWIPQGSPLEVHIFAAVFAQTRVHLAGELETSWPKPLALKTPGNKFGGALSFHYGIEAGAQAKIDISVAGQQFTWTGDIPYVPQIDFQVKGIGAFDAWGFAPGYTLTSKTQPQKLAKVSIGSIIGGSIPGIDGGFELDVAMELSATYVTDRIVIDKIDMTPVEGGPIMSQADESSVKYKGGPNFEADIHPEGTVDYDGVLHLIPAFYVSLLGSNWQIPIADVPIPFPIAKTDWIFDAQRAHVPLPDLVVPNDVIEFGDVEVGQKLLKPYSLLNAGEAAITLAVTSSDPDQFAPFDAQTDVAPLTTFDTALRFIPLKAGEFTATLTATSNDPSDPVQTFKAHGRAYDGAVTVGTNASPEPGETGGCACRTEQRGGAGGPALWALGLAAGAASLRRRRTGRIARRD